MTTEEVLAQVAAEVRGCTRCDLYKGTRNGVPGEGDPRAEVMLIGEGPGFNEDKQGRPFVGAAGQFLNELLAAGGLERSTVFITNVVKHRPPENRDPLPSEILACSAYLESQIAAINPRVLVTLGRHSMGKFFPGAKISQIHGQARVIDGRVVVAMYHPAAALHQGNLKQTVLDDFARAVPAALAQARQLAAQGKGVTPTGSPAEKKPPEQMSLF